MTRAEIIEAVALPDPAVTYADHSFPAYSRAQMRKYADQVLVALLAAVREPSEGVVEAANRAYERHGQTGDLRTQRVSNGAIVAIWTAMLDALAQEIETGGGDG